MNVPVDAYIAVSAILFFIGVVGIIARRNPLIQLMSIELLFNSANLALVTRARFRILEVDGTKVVVGSGGGGGGKSSAPAPTTIGS